MGKTTPLLIAACAVLGGLVWLDNSGTGDAGLQASAPVRPDVATDVPADASRPQTQATVEKVKDLNGASLESGNPLAVVDKASLSDTVERPLFAPSRSRPPQIVEPEEVAVSAPPPPPPPSYALLGVVSDGGRAIALLQKVTDGTSYRVEAGDTVGGWQVAKVEPTSVRLERVDGTSRVVRLQDMRRKSGAGSSSPDLPDELK